MSFSKLRTFTKRVLVFLNVAVCIPLIIGCYGKYLDPNSFWFTGLFTLSAFYFLLLVLSFFFFWLLAKPSLALISLITVALCWNPLGDLVQLRFSAQFTITKHPSHLRVASWNVEHFDILEYKTHPERKKAMLEMIRLYNPDVACFQEVVASEDPTAINNINRLMQDMGFRYYHYTYNKKLDFDEKHHFGIIIFSKLPLIHEQSVSYAPNDYNSIFQFADVVRGTDTFRIFNVHMQSLRFSENNRLYIEQPTLKGERDIIRSKNIISKLHIGFIKRSEQSEHIRSYMDQSPYPNIVCGDFNDVPNSYAYYTIGKNMKNAFREKGTGIGRTFYSISPTLRIDHIFCDKRFNVEQFVRIKKKLSDHFPLITDLYFNVH